MEIKKKERIIDGSIPVNSNVYIKVSIQAQIMAHVYICPERIIKEA